MRVDNSCTGRKSDSRPDDHECEPVQDLCHVVQEERNVLDKLHTLASQCISCVYSLNGSSIQTSWHRHTTQQTFAVLYLARLSSPCLARCQHICRLLAHMNNISTKTSTTRMSPNASRANMSATVSTNDRNRPLQSARGFVTYILGSTMFQSFEASPGIFNNVLITSEKQNKRTPEHYQLLTVEPFQHSWSACAHSCLECCCCCRHSPSSAGNSFLTVLCLVLLLLPLGKNHNTVFFSFFWWLRCINLGRVRIAGTV